MSTLLTRAPRALMFAVAAIFVMSLLAPLAAVANVDLQIGDQAAITNPNGSGANLRSDISTLDDSTVILELAQDTHVTIIDGPVVNDNGVWFRVLVADPIEGWVEASLLTKVAADTTDPLANAPEAPVEAEPVSGLPWLEPIDSAVVVDDNTQLPAEGLAVRVSATVDGEVIGRAPVGSTLDVTEARIWVGEQSFVRVNFNGQGGYVNGNFVVLDSEVVPEPVAEEPVVEEPVAEEPVAEEPVVQEPVAEEPVADEPVVQEPVVEQPAPADQIADEPVVDEAVTDAPEADAPVADAPAEDTTSEDVPATDPVDEQITEEAPADVPAETDAPADVPAEDAVVEQPVVDELADPATPPTENVIDPATPTVEDTTDGVEQPADAPQADAPQSDAPVAGDTADEPVADETTSEPTTTEEEAAVTEEPVDAASSTDATAEATEPVVEDTTPAVTTAAAFDASTMIGSATVTGTTDGLRCRVAPDPDAATLMVLAEGTKVLVFAEPENGYLGIDCGGVQGYGDVAYLWSGGAVDADIPSANLTLTVSGTGNGLNCRTGAGLNYPVITVLSDGTTLTTRGSASNGWVGVTCGGQQGYVSVTWVDVKTSSDSTGSTGSGSSGSTTSGTATVVNTNGDGLYCRSGAGTTFSIITVLSPGQTVSVRGANQGSWTPVTCAGVAGYASSQYLSISSGPSAPTEDKDTSTDAPAPATGTVTVANTGGMGLNCRSGAGTSYGVITVLSLGQTVSTRSGSVSGWTAVVCGGKNGFVASEFTTSGGTAPTESEKPTTQEPAPQPSGMAKGDHAESTANVNLRYSASLSAGIATVVPDGTVVLITGSASNGFYPVDYDGLAGFMSSDYLVKTSAALSERGGSANPTTPSEPAPAPGGSATGSALVDYAMNYLGYPYVWATHGPSSFDCSGFTYWVVWNVLGINMGWGTWTQVSYGTPVGRNDVQPGDLIFHQNTYTAGLSHVGMYIGNGKMINALNENAGVVVTDITTSYWESRWYGARRL